MEIRDLIDSRAHVGLAGLTGEKLLVIGPDSTRSGGHFVGEMLRALMRHRGSRFRDVTYLVALGTHAPMPEEKVLHYLGIESKELAGELRGLQIANHEWNDPSMLATIGRVSRDDMLRISEGKFDLARVKREEGFDVQINKRVLESDLAVIVGPVLPHEVVGMSGGNKYFFPGVAGIDCTQFTHFLGALEGIPRVMGIERTVVRDAIDHMASLIKGPELRCAALVLGGGKLHDVEWGTPIEAHHRAAPRALELNSRAVTRKYRTIVGVCPPKYPEIWTAGKVSYKLQGIVADGGELVIVAPHLDRVSATWGETIERVGYRTMSSILERLDEFLAAGIPLGVLAHVTHVRGDDAVRDGRTVPRISISIASKLSPELCSRIGLAYRDPAALPWDAWRADPDTLIVEDAGEVLYRLERTE